MNGPVKAGWYRALPVPERRVDEMGQDSGLDAEMMQECNAFQDYWHGY